LNAKPPARQRFEGGAVDETTGGFICAISDRARFSIHLVCFMLRAANWGT
jgi:hypothetical protein